MIASLFIGLERSLITEYERNCLKLIDLQTSLNNELIFIHTLIDYMHYEMLQNNNEQEKSKYEQISIIPKRDADQKPFRICVPPSRFLSPLTWIEENREKELSPSDMVD
ncbi:unnamed protein product [Adineta steineri]|uniref:Uncharacterized protein n=1 Tax=Adineta steineri TaxID=433720 RepID=A0A819WRS2_9BILA|nr:unnamed protein product [Adineta steineri]